ncbi:MAG: CDP-glycerol glycerophosphotransferase family protein [Proteobacteria bacterium]|nr:CDP-glycerol glycerophosphotransferase family protein [Pseudomonadota bacterium]
MNAFVCMVPLHYYVFRSIYESLEDSVFLIPPQTDKPIVEYGGGMSSRGLYDYVYSFLKQKHVNVVDYGPADIDNFADFIKKNVRNIICPHMFTGVHLLDNVRIFKIVYGIPRNIQAQFKYELNYLMDFIIAFGEEASERYKSRGYDNIFYAGNPMFDDWFNDNIDEVLLEQIETRLDHGKPTLLYLPTWNTYSSINTFADEVLGLSNDYNIIIKLHHCTFNGEIDRLCKFMSYPEINVFGDYMDPLVLYRLSDLVLTDGLSGSTFDALLLGKPTIMLGSSVEEYGIDIFENEILSSDNRGQRLVETVTIPKDLPRAIQNNLGKRIQLNEELERQLFFKTDGKSGERIAKIVVETDDRPVTPLLEKYDKALKLVSDIKQRGIIEGSKNDFLQHCYPEQTKKLGIISRISHRLFRN